MGRWLSELGVGGGDHLALPLPLRVEANHTEMMPPEGERFFSPGKLGVEHLAFPFRMASGDLKSAQICPPPLMTYVTVYRDSLIH